MARKANEIIHLKLRLPEGLRKQLEKAAEASERSMNAEIIHRLGQSFKIGDIDTFVAQVVATTVDVTISRLEDDRIRREAEGKGSVDLSTLTGKKRDEQ